jgi:polysaccharide export outer membrane protein
LIALVGGLSEYADSENIQIIRATTGTPEQLKFNYKEILRQKRPEQNVLLKPGDTVVVP